LGGEFGGGVRRLQPRNEKIKKTNKGTGRKNSKRGPKLHAERAGRTEDRDLQKRNSRALSKKQGRKEIQKKQPKKSECCVLSPMSQRGGPAGGPKTDGSSKGLAVEEKVKPNQKHKAVSKKKLQGNNSG